MNSPTFSIYDWIKQIPGDVLRLDEIPLLGFPPPFPWKDFTSLLNRSLQIDNLKLEPSDFQWRAQNELFSGLGDQLQAIRFNITPLSGSLSWVMPEKDIAKLISILVTKNKVSAETIDSDYLNSFYRFIAVEVVNAVEKSDFDKKLSVVLLEDKTLPSETSLCLDILISLGEENLHGRLFLSPEFRSSWKQRYLTRQTDFALKSPMAEKLSIIVHIEGGKTHLTKSEWKNVNLGDVLILDSCTLDVGEDKGRVMLTINGSPFFRAKVKQGSIKILEHPLYHEVDTNMSKESHEDDEDTEEYDDESVEEDTDADSDDDLDFDDLDEETESELEDDTESDEDEEHDEDEHDEDDVSDTEEEKKPSKPASSSKEKSPALTSVEKTSPVSSSSIEDMSMPIILEVGRIQMSVKQLMEMQPGNMLELNIHPENGIDLVANGTRIAKGELLRIGEVLGVRILELF